MVGIAVPAGTGYAIVGNSVYSNTGLGIDLGTSSPPTGLVTPNDVGDADTGPNNLQNYPVLATAYTNENTTSISGTLNSTANTQFTLHFYANATCDASGYGEGQTYLGSGTVTTDASGNASFDISLPVSVASGASISATATDPANNTSEFSACIQAAFQAMLTDYHWHYDYDGLSRVTYACSSWTGLACEGNEFHYSYDGAGNLTRFDKWNATTDEVDTVRYAINGANQIACIDTDASGTCNGSETLWVYDPYGNLTSDGTTMYTYDKANRVSSITAAGVTTTYKYNGDGDRIEQKVGEVTTTYVLDTATPLTMVLSETTSGVTTRYWHGLDTLAQSDGTTTQYFAYDGLGSVRQLVDATGSVGLAQTFDPYGNGYSKAGSAQSALGYTGEQTDSNGFVFLRARYYKPSMGRFFQRDMWKGNNQRPQSLNVYMYVEGRVVVMVDPTGQSPLSDPAQANGDVTSLPMYFDLTGTWFQQRQLEFEPNVDFQPARLFTGSWVPYVESLVGSDWNIPGSQFDIPGYTDNYNLCGTVSVVAILQNLLGINAPGMYEVLNALIDTDGADIGTDTGIIDPGAATQPVGFEVLQSLASVFANSQLKGYFGKEYTRYVAEDIRPYLDGTRWPIILINIDKNPKHPNYKVVPYNSGEYAGYEAAVTNAEGNPITENGVTKMVTIYPGIRHFVVITGLSKDWNTGSAWKWVRTFNPISNSSEYYRADEIFQSQTTARNTLWICKKSDKEGCLGY